MFYDGCKLNSCVNDISKPCHTYPDCPYEYPPVLCEPDKCKENILCNQAKVSRCEAQLFCTASERLICELGKAKNSYEAKPIIEMINGLLTSSAAKELSLAEIIKAVNKPGNKCSPDCK